MGIIPAPYQPDPGSITVTGDPTALTLTGSAGPVSMLSGAGAVVRRLGRSILMDSVFSDPIESFSLFTPGSPGAVTLGTWRNTNRLQQVYVRKMLANWRVAQTTADAANYYRLKITDAAAATAVLPMTAVTGVYLLDRGVGSVLARGVAPPTPTGAAAGTAFQGWGFAQSFTCAQQLLVTGLEIGYGLTMTLNGAGNSPATRARGSILDANGNVLGSAYVTLSGTTNEVVDRKFAFSQSVVIQPNTTYYMAWDIFENAPAVNPANTTADMRMGINTTNVVPLTDTLGLIAFGGYVSAGFNGGSPPQPTPTEVASLSWPALVAGTQVSPSAGITIGAGVISNHNFDYRLIGSPAGYAALSGDLTFAIDAVGAPVATALGTDLNLSALLSTT